MNKKGVINIQQSFSVKEKISIFMAFHNHVRIHSYSIDLALQSDLFWFSSNGRNEMLLNGEGEVVGVFRTVHGEKERKKCVMLGCFKGQTNFFQQPLAFRRHKRWNEYLKQFIFTLT